MNELVEYAERLTRAALEKLPDGEWSFEDWIDDDGVDYGKPIRLFVTITKTAGHMRVDWTGTAPQVRGAINNTLSFTQAASFTAVRSVLPLGIPNNEGVFRAIEVICPPGTIGNGVLPAACAARGLTGFRMTDCMFGALAMMLPDRVKAAGDGGNTGVSIGGYYADRRPFIFVDFTCGAWGARPWADGLDGNSHMFTNMASQSIEVIESEHPIQLLAYEFVADKAGAGKYRGGVPFRRDYRFLEDEGVLQVRSDRRDHRPFGLYGGSPGSPSENYFSPMGRTVCCRGSSRWTSSAVTCCATYFAGAGGWGDPLERDPAAVLRDVRNELLSAENARNDYGVVIDLTLWTVRRRGECTRTRAHPCCARLERSAKGPAPGSVSPYAHNRVARTDSCNRPPAASAAGGAHRPTMNPTTTYRVGVDIGGTFTDIVLLGSDDTIRTWKISSSVDDYARAIVEGLAELFAEAGLTGGQIEEIRHGTTVASNAILEHKGALVGLITTRGFRDVLEIRTLRMPRLYDLAWTKPAPLIERYLRRTVDERIDARGTVERPPRYG